MPLSLPLPRLGLDPSSPHNKPHLRQAVALSQSLYELVHLPQLPIKSHHSLIEPLVLRPEPFDFIGLTLPRHHRLPSVAGRCLASPLPQQCGFAGAGMRNETSLFLLGVFARLSRRFLAQGASIALL